MSEVLAKYQEIVGRGYRIGSYSQKRDGYEFELTKRTASLTIPVKTQTQRFDNMVNSVLGGLRTLGYKTDKPTISGNEERVSSNIMFGGWDPERVGHVTISPTDITLVIDPDFYFFGPEEKCFLKHLTKLAPYLDELIANNRGQISQS